HWDRSLFMHSTPYDIAHLHNRLRVRFRADSRLLRTQKEFNESFHYGLTISCFQSRKLSTNERLYQAGIRVVRLASPSNYCIHTSSTAPCAISSFRNRAMIVSKSCFVCTLP